MDAATTSTSSITPNNQAQPQPQAQQQKLDYLSPSIVTASPLPQAGKDTYIQQLMIVDNQFSDPNASVDDMLAALSQWRQLSVAFYQQAGVQGELVDEIGDIANRLNGVDLAAPPREEESHKAPACGSNVPNEPPSEAAVMSQGENAILEEISQSQGWSLEENPEGEREFEELCQKYDWPCG